VTGDLLSGLDATRQESMPAGAAKMSRDEIVVRYGVDDLKSPRAHRCFRCDASAGVAFGRRGEKLVFACAAHIEEL
jgi:hypothetical protein